DVAINCQPCLAVSLRPGDRRHAKRLRPYGSASNASGITRLAGSRVPRREAIAQIASPIDRDVGHLSPSLDRRRNHGEPGYQPWLPLADEPAPIGSGSSPRCRPVGERQARSHVLRTRVPGLKGRAPGTLAALRVRPVRPGRPEAAPSKHLPLPCALEAAAV